MTEQPPIPDDVTFLPPNDRLKRKIGKDISMDAILTPAVIKRAELVVERKKDEFRDMAFEEIATLAKALTDLKASGAWDEDARRMLVEPAFNLKCWAGTFGYALASDVAKSLYGFAMEAESLDKRTTAVLSAHLDTLRVIFDQRITGDGGKLGQQVLAEMRRVIDKLLS